MEKLTARYKGKSKKPPPTAKPKTAKKRKSEGPTCSMFLAELSRKLATKKKQEEEKKNIIQSVIESLTNALPVNISRRSPPKVASPTRMITLQQYAPELLPSNTIEFPSEQINVANTQENESEMQVELEKAHKKEILKIPQMPLVNSDVFKQPVKKDMLDEAVDTRSNHDVASEITKHVNTLRKISLIAEEFNQKTAKNLKDILESVQEDLVKKLEELQFERRAVSSSVKSAEIMKEDY